MIHRVLITWDMPGEADEVRLLLAFIDQAGEVSSMERRLPGSERSLMLEVDDGTCVNVLSYAMRNGRRSDCDTDILQLGDGRGFFDGPHRLLLKEVR